MNETGHEVDAFSYGSAGMRNMSTLEKQLIESKRMAEINRKINGADMSLGQNSLLSGALVSNHTIGNTTLAAHTGPLVSKESYNSSRLEMQIVITQADNGFVLNIGNEYGARYDIHIAKTIEEVNTIITSQLASRMLDKVK